MAYVDYFGMDVVPDPIPAVHQVSMTAHIEPGAFIAVQIPTPTNTRRLGQYPPFMAAYYRVTTPLVGGLQPIAVPPGGVADALQPVIDAQALAGLLPEGVKMDANAVMASQQPPSPMLTAYQRPPPVASASVRQESPSHRPASPPSLMSLNVPAAH